MDRQKEMIDSGKHSKDSKDHTQIFNRLISNVKSVVLNQFIFECENVIHKYTFFVQQFLFYPLCN